MSYTRKIVYLALLTLSACAYIAGEYKKPLFEDNFEYVCYRASIEFPGICNGLPEPIVVKSGIIKTAGWGKWRGVYYDDEPYVFVDPDLDEAQMQITIRHEIGHYVLVRSGTLTSESSNVCEHERLVRKWSGGLWGVKQKKQYRCNN